MHYHTAQHRPDTAGLPAWQVVGRIFPLRRGLYEDYVSNFWCASSLLLKWQKLIPGSLMVRVAAGSTLAAAAPALLAAGLRPSPEGLLRAMANSAFAFYMFSYQAR